MKLYELIDFEPKKTSRDYDKLKQTVRGIGNSQRLGSGAFGAAYDIGSNKRLNQVTKIGQAGAYKFNPFSNADDSIDSSEADGYLSYLKMVYDWQENGNNNPYFPRIHDLKVFTDSNGKISYRVNLEKLIPFESKKVIGNEDLIKSLCEHMFTSDVIWHDGYFGDTILNIINRALTSDSFRYIGDNDLKRALIMISKIIKSNKSFNEDIHAGNVMWRKTDGMPQLVITDPLN